MGAIITLAVIALISFLVVRIGTTALVATGLGRDTASFQATSAFFGAGFTTSEAELVVSHPVRRRVIRDLIISGNIGITGLLASFIVTLVGDQTVAQAARGYGIVAAAFGVLLVLWVLGLRRVVDFLIKRALHSAGFYQPHDYDHLLHARDGYVVTVVPIDSASPIAGHTLGEGRLRSNGVVVLGIQRAAGDYVGAPDGDSRVLVGDLLTVYGRSEDLRRVLDVDLASFQTPQQPPADAPVSGSLVHTAVRHRVSSP